MARQRTPKWEPKPCAIDGCRQPIRSAHAKYCEKHYMRAYRNGDPNRTLVRVPNGTCHHCGAFAAEERLFCSIRCQRRNRIGAAGAFDTCVCCGGEIDRPFATIYCGKECQAVAERGRRYGLAADEMHRLTQSDACMVCKRTGLVLVVDHDHETGAFRGILCSQCNVGIGMLQDSPEIMRAAALYIEERHGAQLGQQHTQEPAA